MGNGGIGVGLSLVTFGGWLLYAAVTNQAPLKTVEAIVANPRQAGAILKDRKLPLAVSATDFASSVSLTGTAPSLGGAAVVTFARSKIGQPYKFGGASDGGWDCSGLTQKALAYGLGLSVPHSSMAQLLSPSGTKVARADLQPGDLCFPELPGVVNKLGDHVQIYSGNGNVIEAPEEGKNVREVAMWGFFTARRFAIPAPLKQAVNNG